MLLPPSHASAPSYRAFPHRPAPTLAILCLSAFRRGFGGTLLLGLLLACFVCLGLASAAQADVVTSTLDDGSYGTLREVTARVPAPPTITFDPTVFATKQTITLTQGPLPINSSIIGPAAGVVVDGGGSRVFVVQGGSVASPITLSGLTIQNGQAFLSPDSQPILQNEEEANDLSLGIRSYSSGGGLYNLGVVALTDCTFTGNDANAQGGGIFNYGGSVTLTDCTFTSNSAVGGGGLFNGSDNNNNIGTVTLTGCNFTGNGYTFPPFTINGYTFPDNSGASQGGGLANSGTATLTDCTFSNNTANGSNGSGGGIWNDGMLTLTSCAFTGNAAEFYGGGLHNTGGIYLGAHDETYVSAVATLTGCNFINNTSTNDGGGIENFSTVMLSGCTLAGNSASSAGGGLDNNGVVILTNCGLTNNTVANSGGGLHNNGTATLIGCTLTGNSSTSNYGGGISNDNTATLTLTDCALNGNTAPGINGEGGGGFFNLGTATLTNISFAGNSAAGGGGGLANDSAGGNNAGGLTLTNCTFTGNSAPGSSGGGLANDGPTVLTNCTFTGNSAVGGGGLNQYGGAITLTNDIFYGDTGGEIITNAYNQLTVTYCDIQGGYPYQEIGIINADPLFVSGSAPYDLHLQAGSPCIGAGTSSGAPATDIEGTPRPNPPSMGAYEGAPATATGTALTSSPNPAAYGQSVTVTATITGSGGTPTGTVAFYDGTTLLGNATVSAGKAMFSTSSLAAGSHSITAYYSGDPHFAGSTSLPLTQTVKAVTTLTVTNISGTPGQTVTLSAVLTRTADGTGVSGKTVTFSVDGSVMGTGTTQPSGTARLSYVIPANDSVGSHAITAAFAGDSAYDATSGTGTLSVLKFNTILHFEAVSGTPGQTVTLAAVLTRSSGGAAVPGETITFSVDGTVVGTAKTQPSGTARLSYVIPSSATTGGHPVGVSFAGDGSNNACSGTGTLTVQVVTTLTVNAVSVSAGQTVTLSAVLTKAAGGAGVSGKTITFIVDGTVVGTAKTASSGTARLSYVIPSSATSGSHTLSDAFAGDTSDTASSGTGTLTVH